MQPLCPLSILNGGELKCPFVTDINCSLEEAMSGFLPAIRDGLRNLANSGKCGEIISRGWEGKHIILFSFN